MTTAPDAFDYERSRAAVAIACLQWLRCTGPAAEPAPTRVSSPEVVALLNEPSEAASQDPGDPHPLWDRWLDG